MKGHYTQSTASRNLDVGDIHRLSEAEAYESLKQVRWAANHGHPICPKCGCLKAYPLKRRAIFKCSACSKQFSLTSGTILARRKMSYRKILLSCADFAMEPKGKASVRMARTLRCDPKVAFVHTHKLREVMAMDNEGVILFGEVEIDGCYTGKYRKPANYRENRIDRRRRPAPNQKSVCVARERRGRCRVQVGKKETHFIPFVLKNVDHNAVIYSDEALGWSELAYTFQLKQINHQECFSDGYACTNQAESFHSRFRRAEHGVYHHVSGSYADLYAEETAWRENFRRTSDAERYLKLVSDMLKHGNSRRMAGYWQRWQHDKL